MSYKDKKFRTIHEIKPGDDIEQLKKIIQENYNKKNITAINDGRLEIMVYPDKPGTLKFENLKIQEKNFLLGFKKNIDETEKEKTEIFFKTILLSVGYNLQKRQDNKGLKKKSAELFLRLFIRFLNEGEGNRLVIKNLSEIAREANIARQDIMTYLKDLTKPLVYFYKSFNPKTGKFSYERVTTSFIAIREVSDDFDFDISKMKTPDEIFEKNLKHLIIYFATPIVDDFFSLFNRLFLKKSFFDFFSNKFSLLATKLANFIITHKNFKRICYSNLIKDWLNLEYMEKERGKNYVITEITKALKELKDCGFLIFFDVRDAVKKEDKVFYWKYKEDFVKYTKNKNDIVNTNKATETQKQLPEKTETETKATTEKTKTETTEKKDEYVNIAGWQPGITKKQKIKDVKIEIKQSRDDNTINDEDFTIRTNSQI